MEDEAPLIHVNEMTNHTSVYIVQLQGGPKDETSVGPQTEGASLM